LKSQSASTRSDSSSEGSSTSLLPTILKLTVRGSLKTKPILFTIALFIAINIGVHAMANSYESEAINLISLYSGQQYVAVSEKPQTNALKIQASPFTIDARTVLLISTETFGEFLRVNGAWLLGRPPIQSEVAVGEELRLQVNNGLLLINGQTFKVTGYIQSNSYLAYSVVATTNVFPSSQTLYMSTEKGNDAWVSAPAAVQVARSVFSEILAIMGLVGYTLYGALGLCCLFQGYNSLIESEEILQTMASIGAPKRMVNVSMLGYAFITSLAGTLLGFVLGTFIPGLTSSIISVAFKLPHLKPIMNAQIGFDLMLGFSASLLALSTGLLGGYSRQIAAT
jgi:hypothetical protein